MRVLLTGSSGMLGSSFSAALARDDRHELVALTRSDVDLRDRAAVRRLLDDVQPDAVVHAAAKVAGIAAKLAAPLDYLLDNLLIDTSIIEASLAARVSRLLYVGTAAVYPAIYERPYEEDDLLTGALEPANEGYALAKVAAVKLCQYASAQHDVVYRSVLPSNLYGPHDHFGSEGAHLVAATLTKVHRAHVRGDADVEIWGDGTARREFTYSDDVAAWTVAQLPELEAWPPWLNIGAGVDHSIAEYYEVARDIVGFEGSFRYDVTKPAGVPRRLIDSSTARQLGWSPATSLRDGMAQAYRAFLATNYET